jgi:hypothetical protein
MDQDDVGRERGQFRRVSANLGGIGGPASMRTLRPMVQPDIASS